MKKLFPFLLVAVLATSCVTYRQVSRDANPTWAGCTTTQIIQAMGSPDRIDSDGAGGAILRYDSQPDYEDPSYDILNPDPAPDGQRGHAYFYMNPEGVCYQVDSDRALPAPPDKPRSVVVGSIWLDMLVYLPLMLIFLL